MNLNRAPKWDQHRPQFLKFGLSLSIALAFMAFNYTSYSDHEATPIYSEPLEDPYLEVTPPIMRDQKKLPPPPTPKVEILDIVEPTVEPEFVEEKLPEIEAEPSKSTPSLTKVVPVTPATSAPMELPKAEPEEDEIVVFAERMPVYNTCDLSMTEAEKRKCTQGQLLSHIYNKLRYPPIARENNIYGTVVVGFVVDKHGTVINTEILKDIGGGCGSEVLRVVEQLGSFHPGKQNGRPVSVMYRIPVKFELQ